MRVGRKGDDLEEIGAQQLTRGLWAGAFMTGPSDLQG
jgi:hypothetical protein